MSDLPTAPPLDEEDTMKSAISWKARTAVALVAIACLATTQTAQAVPSLSIRVANNGGAFGSATSYTLSAGPNGTFTYSNSQFASGLLDLSISIQTNSPGTSSLAQLVDTSTTIRDNGTTFANTTIEITVTDTSYTQPLDPSPNGLILSNAFTGSPSSGLLGSVTGSLTGTVLVGNTTIKSGSTLLNGGTNTSTFGNAISPFTIRNVTTVTLTNSLFGTGSALFNGVGSVSVFDRTPAVATPEPATTALAVSGLAALGLAGLRRRLGRKADAAA